MATLERVSDAGPTPLRAVVAGEVRALCGRYSIRQGRLAAWLGITQSQVSKRLRGDLPFTLDEVESLAEGFAVEPAALFGLVPAKPSGPPPLLAVTGRTGRLPRMDSNHQPAGIRRGNGRGYSDTVVVLPEGYPWADAA